MGSPTQVVMVTQDQGLVQSVSGRLGEAGMGLLQAPEFSAMMKAALEGQPSLFIVDASCPVGSVVELCRTLRGATDQPIIVLLGAGVREPDEATLFHAGADDCMRHPIGQRELVARVRAHLRRRNQAARDAHHGWLRAGGLEIDVAGHSVRRLGRPVSLTPLEFSLLLHLVTNRGRVVTRAQLLEKVWGWGCATTTRTVDVRVRLLRRKLETDPDRPTLVVTVTGVGYRFDG